MHRVMRGMSENGVKIVNKRVDRVIRVAEDDLTCHMRHTTLPSSISLPTFTLFDLFSFSFSFFFLFWYFFKKEKKKWRI